MLGACGLECSYAAVHAYTEDMRSRTTAMHLRYGLANVTLEVGSRVWWRSSFSANRLPLTGPLAERNARAPQQAHATRIPLD